MKQLTKCHVFQAHVVAESVENLAVGRRLCEALRVRLSVGLAVSLCDPQGAETLGRNSNVPKSPPLARNVWVRTLPSCTFDPILPRTQRTSLSSFPVLFKPSYNFFAFSISFMLHTSPDLRILLDLIRLAVFGVGSYQNRCHERKKTSRA